MSSADYLSIEQFTVLEQIQRWMCHADKPLADCARRFMERDGLVMVEPPPPVNPLEADNFGEWEPELYNLLKSKGFNEPQMYCLTDRVKGKYRQPYREEKDADDQSAVNTIRVMVDGQTVAIGKHLPRLQAVIEPPEDRIYYYIPKEIRVEAQALSKQLKESSKSAST